MDFDAFNRHKQSLFKKLREEFNTFNSDEMDLLRKSLGLANDKKRYELDTLCPVNIHPLSLYKIKNNMDRLGLDVSELYKLNSSSLRSDEFKRGHSGRHILFAGCSVTFGDGIPLEYTWPKMTYNAISKAEPVSGFYNVARPGLTATEIINQIFKYIRLYGNPDTIFICFPDVMRENRMIETLYGEDVTEAMVCDYYNALVMYCDLANIRIISFTWDDMDRFKKLHPDKMDPRSKFKYFYKFSATKMQYPFMTKYIENNKDHPFKEFMMSAMDDYHPGIAEHAFLYDFSLNCYYGIINESSEESK